MSRQTDLRSDRQAPDSPACPSWVAFLVNGIARRHDDARRAAADENAIRLRREVVTRPVIFIGMGTCGLGAGAGKTLAAVRNYLQQRAIEADIVEVGCFGLCSAEPLLDVQLPGRSRICFKAVTQDKVESLLDTLWAGTIPTEMAFGQFRGETHQLWPDVPYLDEHPFFAPQTRWVLANCGILDPSNTDEYIAWGGYQAFARAVRTMTRLELCDSVEHSGLRGRGGGGFPTGTKWKVALNTQSEQKYLICNADEGDPGALREQSHIKEVLNAIDHPDMFVVVQHAPSVSVTLAEEFNLKPGIDICGVLTAVLRQLGFNRVFETAFSADLTVIEEASELAHRLSNGGPLPMMTSCSPGWTKYVEQFYPDFVDNASTCKSPQQMMGAVTKSYFAERQGIDPRRIFSVSIMPCTAKKFEAGRPEMARDGVPDIDAVLTTRELARIVRMRGINLRATAPQPSDTSFGERSTAGKLFGASGGVMEAALRTAHYLLTGKELELRRIRPLRGSGGVKETRVAIGGRELNVAAVSGLDNARLLLDQIRAGRRNLHFIEVMTCPGGCVAGGGQPLTADVGAVRARMQALYTIDRDEPVRAAHNNQSVRQLYDEFLGEPLSDKSHELLHTHYAPRKVVA